MTLVHWLFMLLAKNIWRHGFTHFWFCSAQFVFIDKGRSVKGTHATLYIALHN